MSIRPSSKFPKGIVENFRSDYDTKFTTDVSKQMQMPDRLAATNNPYNNVSQPFSSFNDSATYPALDMPCYMMDSPPRVLTLHEHAFMGSDDENADENSELEHATDSEVQFDGHATPNKREEHLEEAEIEVPVTPGTMLLLQNGDDMAVIKRQVAKLTRHVIRLQEDNNRRRHRELLLYPVLVGYCLFQLWRVFLHSK